MAILVLNAVPTYIPNAWVVSENDNNMNVLQQNDRPHEAPVITSADRSKTITIEWPIGNYLYRTLERSMRLIIESMIVALAQEKYYNQDKLALKVPFTNIEMPSQLQQSCGYLGVNTQILGGYVESFAAAYSRTQTLITWSLSIAMVDLRAKRRQPEVNEKATSPEQTSEGATTLQAYRKAMTPGILK